MKILYLVSGIGPPAGWGTEFIQNLIIKLSQKGVHATIINPIYKHTHPDWKIWTKNIEKKNGVNIISLGAPNWIRNKFLLHLSLTPILVTYEVLKLLGKERFDIIHEFSSTPFILLRSELLKFIFKIPTVFTLSVYNNTILGKLFWFKILDFAQTYLIPSHTISRQIINLGINKKKVIFSPPGIDLKPFSKKLDKFQSRKKLGLPANKFIVAYYGSLTREKGVYDLIRAVQLINGATRKNTLIVLFAIWKGSKEHQKIKEKIDSLKLPQLELVEKYVDIPTVLAASDAAIFPQQTGHGATIPPISIIEALLGKTYIITTKTVGVSEWVDKHNGILLAPNQPILLAQALKQVYQEKSVNRTSQKKYKMLSAAFEINNSVKLHLSLYKSYVL